MTSISFQATACPSARALVMITGGVGHLAAPFWEDACLGRFDLIDVPDNHFSMIEPPHGHTVTAYLMEALRKNS